MATVPALDGPIDGTVDQTRGSSYDPGFVCLDRQIKEATMERGLVLFSARQNGRIIKQNRITGNRLRNALAPEYAPNPLSPVVVTTSEQGLIDNWERRFLRTTQTHLLYPSLIFAGQRLLGGSRIRFKLVELPSKR